MKKIMTGRGYPLGLIKHNGGTYYQLELRGRNVMLTRDELTAWATLSASMEQSEIDGSLALKTLIEEGIVVAANSINDLLNRIMSSHVIRQGIGVQRNGYGHIRVMDKDVPITESQMRVWRMSNGRTSIAEMYEEFFGEEEAVSQEAEEQFARDLLYLLQQETIYLD